MPRLYNYVLPLCIQFLFVYAGTACAPTEVDSVSEVQSYKSSEIRNNTLGAHNNVRKTVNVLKRNGWCKAPLAGGMRSNNDLVIRMACIANGESAFGRYTRGAVPGNNCINRDYARGWWQIMPGCHVNKSASYRGQTYTCPNVTPYTLGTNPDLNAQCALKVYVEAINRSYYNPFAPWEAKCAYGVENEIARLVGKYPCG